MANKIIRNLNQLKVGSLYEAHYYDNFSSGPIIFIESKQAVDAPYVNCVFYSFIGKEYFIRHEETLFNVYKVIEL
jgi:hypothetical protein